MGYFRLYVSEPGDVLDALAVNIEIGEIIVIIVARGAGLSFGDVDVNKAASLNKDSRLTLVLGHASHTHRGK
jgi:hypothetical protein